MKTAGKTEDLSHARLTVQEYKDKTQSYVSQRVSNNQKVSLSQEFAKRTSRAFAKAQSTLTFIGTEDSNDGKP